MNRSITLERYGLSADEISELSPVSPEVLTEAIRKMRAEPSAILTVSAGERWIRVSSSGCLFTVGAQIDDEEALNLVGDATATGLEPFDLGGQEVELPRRYLVSIDRAIASALYFLTYGAVDRAGELWDRQGENDAWQREGVG